jgi:hypothetical protein
VGGTDPIHPHQNSVVVTAKSHRSETHKVYFPEPTSPDESWPGWDETAVEWLMRSTAPRARAVRAFLNKSLQCFTPARARSLAKKLNEDWRSFFFEIVVGRYLQVLGAEVEPEPLGTNGTRVDYRVTFPDGIVVSIECVSKRFNQEAQRTMDRHSNMSLMLDDAGPTNWIIEFKQLPEANSPDEFRAYVEQARQFYSGLPEPITDGRHLEFAWEGASGHLELEAIPHPNGTKPGHLGPAVTFFDDSILRLKSALNDEQKRKQALGAHAPVFLAIDCPFNGPNTEDFDQALFGQTVDYREIDSGKGVGTSFDPNGLLVKDRGIPFAGVLAFLNLSVVGGSDPVLYLNPYQRWKLPAALARHQTRSWTSRIETTDGRNAGTDGQPNRLRRVQQTRVTEPTH